MAIAIVTKGKGLFTCPEPRENERQDGLDGLICVLLFEDTVDWGLTSSQGNLEGVKEVREATLASRAKVNYSFVSKGTVLPFHNRPKNMGLCF